MRAIFLWGDLGECARIMTTRQTKVLMLALTSPSSVIVFYHTYKRMQFMKEGLTWLETIHFMVMRKHVLDKKPNQQSSSEQT